MLPRLPLAASDPPPAPADLPEAEDSAAIYPTLKPAYRKFVDAVVAGCNATQAYLAAGYSASAVDHRGAGNSASRLMDNVIIVSAIAERQAYYSALAAVSREQLIAQVKATALGDWSGIYAPGTWDLRPISEWPAELRSLVQSVEHRKGSIIVRFPERLPALALLGKWMGLERSQGTGFSLVIHLGGEADEGQRPSERLAGEGMIIDVPVEPLP